MRHSRRRASRSGRRVRASPPALVRGGDHSVGAEIINDLTIRDLVHLYFTNPRALPAGLVGKSMSDWDVSAVTDTSFLFINVPNDAEIPPLNPWNMSNVTNTTGMFAGTTYNHPLDQWQTGNVREATRMFARSKFDHPIHAWDMSRCLRFDEMFAGAQFDQSLRGWNVSNGINFSRMFAGSQFSRCSTIHGWEVRPGAVLTDMFDRAACDGGSIPPWFTNPALRTGRSVTMRLARPRPRQRPPPPTDVQSLSAEIGRAAPRRDSIPHIPEDAVGYDAAEMAERGVRAFLAEDADHLAVEQGGAFWLGSREQVRAYYADPEFVKFACRQVDDVAHVPRAENVDTSVPYTNLRSLGLGNGLVPAAQLGFLLAHPEIRAVRVSDPPIKRLVAVTSQQMAEGRVRNAVGADHCQSGSSADVFALEQID